MTQILLSIASYLQYYTWTTIFSWHSSFRAIWATDTPFLNVSLWAFAPCSSSISRLDAVAYIIPLKTVRLLLIDIDLKAIASCLNMFRHSPKIVFSFLCKRQVIWSFPMTLCSRRSFSPSWTTRTVLTRSLRMESSFSSLRPNNALVLLDGHGSCVETTSLGFQLRTERRLCHIDLLKSTISSAQRWLRSRSRNILTSYN